MSYNHLNHHGIKGQKWGVRRYQNEDGSLTPRGQKHYAKKDQKFIDKKADKIYSTAAKKSSKEMNTFVKKEMKGMRGATAINTYNRKLAEVMRSKTNHIRSPSGKVVEWVAKRGQTGVYMALADQGYNMDQLKNGIWESGRIGYRKNKVNMNTE